MKLEEVKFMDGIRTMMFECPGCKCSHQVHVAGTGVPVWGWNGDMDRPTFTPSILVTGLAQLTDEEHAAYLRGEGLPPARPLRCHSFVTDGQIQFLSDCSHALAGQTVPIPDFD